MVLFDIIYTVCDILLQITLRLKYDQKELNVIKHSTI